MTQRLQLTEQKNPLAQTFRITEDVGSVITGVGLFFYSTPSATDAQKPITIELRPVQGGAPSSNEYWPGTRVTVEPSVIRSKASTTFSSATEHKFTFKEPIFIPGHTEVAVVAYTSAKVGLWQVWAGEVGELEANSTTKRIKKQLDTGVMYESSNGTSWASSQLVDLAFKVYRAKFNYQRSTAYLDIAPPPLRALTQNTKSNVPHVYPRQPLSFSSGSARVQVIHPNHGFSQGDKVYLTGLDSAASVRGISGSDIVGTRTIDSADAFGYSFTSGGTATSSGRGGGNSLRASEQIVSGHYGVVSNMLVPPYTDVQGIVNFTTAQSKYGQDHIIGDQTPWVSTGELSTNLNHFTQLLNPFVIASTVQEDDPTKLNGSSSGYVKIQLETQNQYAAPSFTVDNTYLRTISWLIDDQQSDDSSSSFKNYMTTMPYVSEEEPFGGTTASKHITVPYTLAESASSIRVYVDAIRPQGTNFDVWYRTTTTDGASIDQVSWKEFSKNINPPNSSNYSQQVPSSTVNQYEFNVYDLADFDQYQIKITFRSTNIAFAPVVTNLRTIATI